VKAVQISRFSRLGSVTEAQVSSGSCLEVSQGELPTQLAYTLKNKGSLLAFDSVNNF